MPALRSEDHWGLVESEEGKVVKWMYSAVDRGEKEMEGVVLPWFYVFVDRWAGADYSL